MITQAGQINVTALTLPDLYVQIVKPQTQVINGVATNKAAIVGTGTWGPKNAPTTIGTPAQGAATFGPIQNRKYDLGTALQIAAQQVANNFTVVRVTDGTDTAAKTTILTNCLTVTSIYTGSFGNTITVTLSAGSAAGSFKAVIGAPGLVPESFDNVGVGLSGGALWAALATAINSGTNAIRGASQIVVASAGVGTAALVAGTSTLAGGTDGATTITGSVLLGVDTVPRTGMYSLRNSGASLAMLADCDDPTTWASQIAYGLGEGTYMIMTGPSGDTLANAPVAKAAAGIDSYGAKLCFGDWVYWLDTTNAVLRVVSPQAFFLGTLANLSPEQSSLNKPMQGVVGTQKSNSNTQYADADLIGLVAAGIDVITNPVPGGSYFGARVGHNSSSNPVINGDNYVRMTNYLAATFDAGMGIFIGRLESPTVQQQCLATLSAFMDNLEAQGMIKDYAVSIPAALNSAAQVALGNLQIAVQAVYFSILEKFIINVEGGTSVQIIRVSTSLVN